MMHRIVLSPVFPAISFWPEPSMRRIPARNYRASPKNLPIQRRAPASVGGYVNPQNGHSHPYQQISELSAIPAHAGICRGAARETCIAYVIVAKPIRLCSVGLQLPVCDLESMSFALRPLPEYVPSDSCLVLSACRRLDIEPQISGLGDAGAEVFKGQGHATMRPRFVANLSDSRLDRISGAPGLADRSAAPV